MDSRYLPYSQCTRRQSAVALVSVALLLGALRAGQCETSQSAPSINYTVKVLTPANTPEAYNSPSGLCQWNVGLPVLEHDTIKITASPVGGYTVTGLSTKVDGKLLHHITSSPWIDTIPANNLSLGQHSFNVTATVNKHNSSASLPLKITIVQSLPPDLSPQVVPVLSTVKGIQQVFSQGDVSTLDPAAQTVTPPVVGSTGHENGDTGVAVSFADDNATTQRENGDPITISNDLTATIAPGTSSADKFFVFSIVRNGEALYTSASLVPLVETGIDLRAKKAGIDGFTAGPLQLYVWGVDQAGNYSAPTVVNFVVNN